MKMNIKKRIVLDGIMLFSLISLQAVEFVSAAIHEALGMFFFVLALFHCLINLNWIKKILKSKKNRLIINIFLSIAFLAAISSGIMQSNVLFKNIVYANRSKWNHVHAWSTRVLLLIVIFHVINNRKMIEAAFYKKRDLGKEV